MSRFVVAALVLAACSSPPSGDTPDGGIGDDADGSIEPDAPQCSPACGDEANAEVSCSVFLTCESTCETGYSRCEGACVAESPQQCGAGCQQCPTPSNGSGTCSDGVCGVSCNAGFVPCESGLGTSCCPFASDVVAPVEMGGYMPSIAVDAQNKLHLAYYRAAENDLVYAEETAAGLTRETVKTYWSSGGNGRFELGLGQRGPIVVYTYPNSGSGLYLAERRTTGWSHSQIVKGTTPPGFGIATDRGGRAHVCITSYEGTLTYGLREGDRWTLVPVGTETEAKGACAIAVDAAGLPHIAFQRTTAADVAYAHRDVGGTFTTTVADSTGSVGSELAIAVGPDGVPHIAAYRSDGNALHHLALANGAWSSENVTMGNIVASVRIVVGASGPVVTWFDYGQYRVMIGTRTGGAWTRLVFDDITRGWGSLAAAPDGALWVATGDDQILAHELKNGAWSSYGIELEGKTGMAVALAHRSAQQPVFVYDVTTDNVQKIEVASRAGSTWTRTQLATAGSSPVAGIDANGKVHVAYQTTTGLTYAAETTGYTSEPVAASGSEPNLTVDAQGTPYLAYVAYQSPSYSLVVAKRTASGWSPTTIGAAAPYNTYRMPVVRVVGGVVHVAWYDGVAKTTVYASSADNYAKVTIEPTSAGGLDMFVTAAGVPHVCTFRQGSSRPTLRYATRATTTWSNTAPGTTGTKVDSGRCAIAVDANGNVGIARAMVYGAGLGAAVLTTIGATQTHDVLQDDFYAFGLGISVGANGFEVGMAGQPYTGSSNDLYRVRWAHR